MKNPIQKKSFFSRLTQGLRPNVPPEAPPPPPSAEATLAKNSEWYYRLGNHYYDANSPRQAQAAWEQSVALRRPPAPAAPTPPSPWRTIGLTLLILFSTYCLIVFAFPRKFDMMEMLLLSMSQQASQQPQELSWWDQFWTTNRPREWQQALEQEELWWNLSRQMESLLEFFAPEETREGTFEEQLVEFLNRFRYPDASQQLEGKSQYYHLIGRGLHNLRKHPEAIESLKEGLRETNNPQERGLLYQEMATIYYFQGYQLQPNGLAKYDLDLVRQSIEAYTEAEKYIQDPYLYGNMGWGYYLLGDYDQAIHYSLKALNMSARLSYVRMNLGITYLRTHNYQKAFEAYQGLLEQDFNTIDYLGGLRDLEELDRDHGGQYPFVNFIRGYIYYHQENYYKAQEAWNIFLNQPFPENSWKQQTRKFMQKMQRNEVKS